MLIIKENNGKDCEFLQINKAREIRYIYGWYEGREDGFEYGKEEGIKVGKIEGIKEDIETTIVNMYRKNFDINTIAAITNCSVDEIKSVIEKIVVA